MPSTIFSREDNCTWWLDSQKNKNPPKLKPVSVPVSVPVPISVPDLPELQSLTTPALVSVPVLRPSMWLHSGPSGLEHPLEEESLPSLGLSELQPSVTPVSVQVSVQAPSGLQNSLEGSWPAPADGLFVPSTFQFTNTSKNELLMILSSYFCD